MVIALIILVALTMAGLALVRSVDTSNIIAGNLAFQQAATHSGDVGVEAAVSWIDDCNNNRNGCTPAQLYADDATNGYSASGLVQSPGTLAQPNETWAAFWDRVLSARAKPLNVHPAGNTVSYVIDRLCSNAGSPTGGANCSSSPVATTATGNAEEANEITLATSSAVYYRITARISGPKNTVSFVQAVVAE